MLNPCGPWKALVGLTMKEDALPLSGLLYEAHLPNGVERPNNKKKESSNADSGNSK